MTGIMALNYNLLYFYINYYGVTHICSIFPINNFILGKGMICCITDTFVRRKWIFQFIHRLALY